MPFFTATFDTHLKDGALHHVFLSAERLDGYDSGVRIGMTELILRHRRRIASVGVLVKSKLVAMGVSVANLALGGFIKSYNSRSSYEAAIRVVETDEGWRAAGPAPACCQTEAQLGGSSTRHNRQLTALALTTALRTVPAWCTGAGVLW